MRRHHNKLTICVFILTALVTFSYPNKYKFNILNKRFSAWRNQNG